MGAFVSALQSATGCRLGGVSFPGTWGGGSSCAKCEVSAAPPQLRTDTPECNRDPKGTISSCCYLLTLIPVLEFCHIEISLSMGIVENKGFNCSVIYDMML